MIDYKQELGILCNQNMERLGLRNNPRYMERLKLEWKHIGYQDDYAYFVDLYEKKLCFSANEHNLLVPYLLGIVNHFDINQPPKYTFVSEFPDVDVDYIPEIQKWLKDVWAPEKFGPDYVCNIGNYTTYGIKSALQDMARVYGLSHEEVNQVTTQVEDKDDEGKPVTWEKALELNKELAAYCEKYPETYDAAKRLHGRVRGQGKHAGGLIISQYRLDDFVPLTADKNGNPLSAWTEGLHAQDLAPVGLVKFDVLVITNLTQISKCLKIIRERHSIDKICNLPGQDDWSDTSYLNDPESIRLANAAKLKCIFQFDSPGIRDLVKKGGVTSFEDLVAYASLYRPGPMGSNLHTAYTNRKRGKEQYTIHPLLQPILENTYGVMCYQEQIMKIFNVVGGFPLPQCYKIVKAISKKKGEIFDKAKVQFVEQCQKRLGYTEVQATEFFAQIEKFSGYAFNKSHAVSYCYVSARLLYLKAHYPLEFFAAVMSCEKDADKIKEYKLEAERFVVAINRIDINKSKVHFEIVDNEIYLGFADIKGIGEELAQRIVSGQPYTSFEDFLERFGTQADVVKALVALRVFPDDEPAVLYEFADHYRAGIKSRRDRDKRYVDSQAKRLEDLRAIVVVGGEENITADFCRSCKGWEKEQFLSCFVPQESFLDGMAEDAFKIVNQFNRSEDNQNKKLAGDCPIRLADFEATGRIDKEMKQVLLHHLSVAENKYYGFPWDYIITQSPDYRGLTFEEFDIASQSRDVTGRGVEVQVIEKPKTIKGKKVTFHKVKVMDGEGRAEMVTVWKEDFERFADEFNKWDSICEWGNLLKLRLKRPSGDYKSYTFESPPKELRWREVPKEKKDDVRCIVLRWPEGSIVKEDDVIERIKEDFTIVE